MFYSLVVICSRSVLSYSSAEAFSKLSCIAKRSLVYCDNGFEADERSDFGMNIPLSRLSMLPNSI